VKAGVPFDAIRSTTLNDSCQKWAVDGRQSRWAPAAQE
jgi:hypothetical protein